MVIAWGTDRKGIPQGLKPPILRGLERPKAEALGYLEAKAVEARAGDQGSKSPEARKAKFSKCRKL